MLRLFAALEVPPDIGQGLVRRQQVLPGARWRTSDSLHVTLRFFGEIDEATAADLDAELAGIAGPSVEVALEGVGSAGAGHQIDTVWAGVRESEPLRVLAGRCESATLQGWQWRRRPPRRHCLRNQQWRPDLGAIL